MSRVQTIIDQKLRDNAEQKFSDLGLNLSEGIRFILTNFVNGNISVTFTQEVQNIKLDPEAKRKYQLIMDDIKSGDNMMDLSELDK